MGPYFRCAVIITDEVAEKVLGTKDAIRVVSSKFYCQIAVSKKSGLNNTLSIYLSPHQAGKCRVWLVRGTDPARHRYSGAGPQGGAHGDASVQHLDARTPFKADHDNADRRVLPATDALMVHDRT